MTTLIAAVLVTATLGALLYRLGREALRFSGARVVTCPETQRAAGVKLKPIQAAGKALYGGGGLELASCSRWPERAGCGQECLSQIESAPDGCLVKSLANRFYEGQSCAICGKRFDVPSRTDHRPALLGPDRVTVPWHEVPAEQLPELFASHRPVCWDCHIVETLMRTQPGLAVVRPPRPSVHL